MLQSILLAVDGSAERQHATRSAALLARKLDGAVHAVHVIDSRLVAAGYHLDDANPHSVESRVQLNEELQRRLETQGNQVLQAVTEELEALGVPCRVELRTGIPAVEVLAASADCDIIVIGRRGQSAADDRKALGEVVERVLRTATQPVLVAGEQTGEFRRVVLGFDGSSPAREAMIYAAELSQRLNIPMIAVSVHRDESLARKTLEVVQHYAEAHKFEVALEVHKGDPVDVLLEVAEPTDLLTIGAFGDGRVREWLLGSTTEALLRASTQPVLLHR
ncbi:MAG: universal stress protein [Ectothiorhodospiraceae bacterium]|nr:universal stress protein [Ectothiorhodospiraceae bacterium]MCH8504379.1 universal stress protein [Ectothiorhodospiraceae bacterium]